VAVHAELIPLQGLSAADMDRWRELAASASEPNPFYEPQYALPAAAALEAKDLSLLVARERAEGLWLGCLPVHPGRRWRGVPLAALVSWNHLYCFLCTPLLARGRERDALEAMLSTALAEGPGSYLGLSLIGAGGAVSDALARASDSAGLHLVHYERAERAGLRRRPDQGGYIAASPKHQRGFARLRRRLSEKLGETVEVVDRAGQEGMVERFLQLESSGWKGREGTALASVESHARMFRHICGEFHAEGRLQLLSLEAGSHVIAMACNLRAGSTIFCFKIGVDESYAGFSPGTLLELGNTTIFHQDTDAEIMDSCAIPGNKMINNLWADRIPIEAVAVATRRRAIVVGPAVRAAKAIRARIRG